MTIFYKRLLIVILSGAILIKFINKINIRY